MIGLLPLWRRSADLTCRDATLRTSPSSGQATTSILLRHPRLLACHSGAAFGVGWNCRWLLQDQPAASPCALPERDRVAGVGAPAARRPRWCSASPSRAPSPLLQQSPQRRASERPQVFLPSEPRAAANGQKRLRLEPSSKSYFCYDFISVLINGVL